MVLHLRTEFVILSTAELADVGLEVTDLKNEAVYASRRLHSRNGAMQMEGLHRIAVAFVQNPETILQELVNAAIRLCGADSAGVSIARENGTPEHFYEWVATAGEYSSFLGASLPQYPSACTVCLERGAPQLFRVNERFFDILGVEAAVVKDGILLPWEVDDMRGTIFVISHSREEAFDSEDLHLMQILANFAAMGIRQHRQHELLLKQAQATAAAAMAHELAHEINNPLQSLTNTLFLAKQGNGAGSEKSLAMRLETDFNRLTALAKRLLELPRKTAAG